LEFSFLCNFLLSPTPSQCLIIQNLSISSAFRPGILPAIKSHLKYNEPQVLVFIYIPPRFGLGDVIQRSIFNFTFSFSYKQKRKKIKIKFEPLKKLCFISKCYSFKISRWLLIMALVAIRFHPSSILASIYVLGY